VDGIADAMSIRFNTRVYELKRQGIPVTVLSLGEAFFELPPLRVEDFKVPAGYHYSHSRGLLELRRVLCDYYAGFGADLDPEGQVLVTPGSKAAIQFALQSILDPGTEALMLQPCWVSYPEQVRLCHAVPVMAPPGTPVAELERWVTERTRVIILCNPDNPTGRMFTEAELRTVVDLARRRDIYVLVDEAYSDFTDPGAFVSAASLDPGLENVIVVNSTSKNLGMSGWRIGYAMSNPGLIDRMLRVVQHVTTCAATVLLWYLAIHFETLAKVARPQIATVVAKRNRLADHCTRIGLKTMPGRSTFYLFVSTSPSALGSVEFAERLLEEERICAVPGIGYGPDCDEWLRVSVGTESEEAVQAALERIKALAEASAPGRETAA
jgi:aspartate aminotransferase/aminotransferase